MTECEQYEPSIEETEKILYCYPQLRAYADVIERGSNGGVSTSTTGANRT